MEELKAANKKPEEICPNPGRPNPCGFLFNSLRNIAILCRPKGGPHERLQKGEGSSKPQGGENVVFP